MLTEYLTDSQKKNLRELLRRLKLDPISIIELFKSKGIRTVIADNVDSGRGLASFLYLILSWARELDIYLGDALEIAIVIDKYQKANLKVKYIDIDLEYDVRPRVLETDHNILGIISQTEDRCFLSPRGLE